jgi:hypothetical protein
MVHLPWIVSCGSSPERLQQWNVNAGTAEPISSGRRIADNVQFTRHRHVPKLTPITFGSGRGALLT